MEVMEVAFVLFSGAVSASAALLLCGWLRHGFETPADCVTGMITLLGLFGGVMLPAILINDHNAAVAKASHVHVVNIGVVEQIDPLWDTEGQYHIDGYRHVQLERREVSDNFSWGSPHSIDNNWYDMTYDLYNRSQDHLVVGNEYMMTYRKEDGRNVVLSFYPKGI